MSMASHQLNLLVNMDPGKAVKGFKAIGSEAAVSLGDAALGLDKLQDKVRNFGLAMVAGSVVAGKGLYELAQSASNLNETFNKTAQIFGDEPAQKLKKWSEDAATAMGMTQQAALDGAATFGVFFKAAGQSADATANLSARMVELASDLTSFYNTSPEEAITAIGAALRGESEPIRRFGVLLDEATLKARAMEMGLISVTSKALTPQQRVLAATQEILAQTTDAQGDYARTSEGMANASRTLAAQIADLKAEFGERLLPAATLVVNVLSDMVALVDALPGPLKSLIAYAAVAGTAFTALGGLAAIMASRLISTKTAAFLLSKAASNLPGPLGRAAGAMQNVNTAASVAKKGVLALGVSMGAMSIWNEVFNNSEMAQSALADFNRSVQGTSEDVVKAFANMVNAEDDTVKLSHLWEDFGDQITIVGDDASRNIEDVEAAFKKLLETDPAGANALLVALRDQVGQLDHNSHAYKENTELIRNLEGRYQDWVDSSLNLSQQLEIERAEVVKTAEEEAKAIEERQQAFIEGYDAMAEASEKRIEAIEKEAEQVHSLADGFGEAAEQVASYVQAANDLVTGQLDVESATLSLQDAQENYINTLYDSEATERDKLQSHNAYLRAVLGVKDAIIAQNQAQHDANGTLYENDQRVADTIAVLEGLKAFYPELATEIQGMIDTYNDVPKQKDVKINFQGKKQSIADVKEYVKNLDGVSKERKAKLLAAINRGEYNKVEGELNDLAEDRKAKFLVEAATDAVYDALHAVEHYVATNPLIWQVRTSAAPDMPDFGQDNTSDQGDGEGFRSFAPSEPVDEDPNKVTAQATNWAKARDRFNRMVARDEQMANAYEAGDLSAAKYQRYLRERLDDYEKYSDEWMAIHDAMAGVEDDQLDKQEAKEQAKAERQAHRDEILANRYESGDLSAEKYRDYLKERLKDTEKYSDEWMAIRDQLRELNQEPKEDAQAAKERLEERRSTKRQTMANKYQLGAITPQKYLAFLLKQMALYPKYSPEWMELFNAYQGVGGDAMAGDLPALGQAANLPSSNGSGTKSATTSTTSTNSNSNTVQLNDGNKYTINVVGWSDQNVKELLRHIRTLEKRQGT